jgi:hypothetical protein
MVGAGMRNALPVRAAIAVRRFEKNPAMGVVRDRVAPARRKLMPRAKPAIILWAATAMKTIRALDTEL